jgi:acyl-coenzyme A thioesterase PaaI-like protein
MSIAQAQARLARVPFATWLGMSLVEAAPGRAVLALPFQPAHANAAGPLNGGASASLLLMAGMVAAWSLVPRRPDPSCTTTRAQGYAPLAVSC